MAADKIVSSLATGGGAGTLGDPYAPWELRTVSISNDDVIGFIDDGVYECDQADAASNVWCLVGAGRSNLTIMPVDASGNYDPDARIRVDASGLSGITSVFVLQGQFHQIIGVEIEGDDGGGAGINISATGSRVANCIVNAVGGNGFSLNAANVLVVNCLAEDCGSNGFNAGVFNNISLAECMAKGNGGTGFSFTTGALFSQINRCIAQGNTSRGFSVGASSLVSRCTARDNGSDGFRESNGSNNVFNGIMSTGNTGYGVNLVSTGVHSLVINPFFGSGGASNSLGDTNVAGEVYGSTTGDPAYTSASDNTPGASSDALDVAWPGVYLVNGSTAVDAGAIDAASNTTSDASRAGTMGVF